MKHHENKTSILLEILEHQKMSRRHLATIKYVVLLSALLPLAGVLLAAMGFAYAWNTFFGLL